MIFGTVTEILTAFVSTGVVKASGSLPSYSLGYTTRDNDFYVGWDAISRDREAFLAWMEEHVLRAVPR